MKEKRWGDTVLVLTGLAFAVLGQYYLSYRREYYRDGFVFYGVAVLIFALLWRRSGRGRAQPEVGGAWDSIRFIVAAVGGAMAVAAGVMIALVGG